MLVDFNDISILEQLERTRIPFYTVGRHRKDEIYDPSAKREFTAEDTDETRLFLESLGFVSVDTKDSLIPDIRAIYHFDKDKNDNGFDICVGLQSADMLSRMIRIQSFLKIYYQEFEDLPASIQGKLFNVFFKLAEPLINTQQS